MYLIKFNNLINFCELLHMCNGGFSHLSVCAVSHTSACVRTHTHTHTHTVFLYSDLESKLFRQGSPK